MKVKLVRWGQTSTVNFQAKQCHVEGEVEEGEDPDEAMAAAKAFVAAHLGLGPSPDEVRRAEEVIRQDKAIRKVRGRLPSTDPEGE